MFKYTVVPLKSTLAYSIISVKKCIKKKRNTILLVLDVECAQMGIKNKDFSFLMQLAILTYKMFSLHQACSPQYQVQYIFTKLKLNC